MKIRNWTAKRAGASMTISGEHAEETSTAAIGDPVKVTGVDDIKPFHDGSNTIAVATRSDGSRVFLENY